MRWICSFAITAAIGVSAPARAATAPVPEATLRLAASHGIHVIEQSIAVWQNQRTCFSCHHQEIPIQMVGLARSRGLAVDDELARKNITVGMAGSRSLDREVQSYQQFDVGEELGIELSTAAEAGIPRGLPLEAKAMIVGDQQRPDGHFVIVDNRPPQSWGTITATAKAVRGLRAYYPESRAESVAPILERARAFLTASVPRDTQDVTFRLFGLAWADADHEALARAGQALLALQREDGGWGQLPARPTDAYATGQALVALAQTGQLATTDERYQRGLHFLLDRQQPDGSWLVTTRMHEQALVSPPHFEMGFPHGEHQVVSCMGSALAVMAMLQALPPAPTPPAPLLNAADWQYKADAPWMHAALTGTAAELRDALDHGLSPNAETPDGTSVLMLAAPDLEKVTLLVDRGADVNHAAKSGFTPLMLALNHRGTAKVAALLIAHGARVQPTAPKPVHDASPLMYAVWSGNVDAINLLLDHGANPQAKMQVGGQIPATPLLLATIQGETEAVAAFLARGSDVNEPDEQGMSLLADTATSNDTAVARLLLARGAKVDAVDELSMTPLMHAASVDFGDTAMVDLLLASGADRSIKSKDGLTALDMAKKYGHAAIVESLSRSVHGN